jgi:GTP pyrophosphokinase
MTKMKQAPESFNEKICSFSESDQERILKVLETSGGQLTGAASILSDLGLDADTVIAALTLESNTNRTLSKDNTAQFADKGFGPEIALLVSGAEKISRFQAENMTIHEAHNIRNMIFALTEDLRAIIIILAVKLNTLRVLDQSPTCVGVIEEERKAAARECLDIYAPLADRLGISWLKDEMEDLSLKFINREAYQQIKSIVAEKRAQRGEFLDIAQEAIRHEAETAGINVEVISRAKHFYSVYMKMRKRGKSAGEIHDLSGIRIICDSIENCYTLLGMVHRLWKPMSGCFDDYIAMPKPNGYQSLHTTVMVDSGFDERQLEIQIRTTEMQEIAENGIASHWLYKKGSSRDMVRPEDIGIVNRLKSWRQGSWLEDIKREMLKDSIYVFTPQSKVIKLPIGATPIDFAYHVHTAVGERCMGAKVNGSIVPLSAELKNTQIVEILTGNAAHPHFNWLELAKSSRARSKIRSWLEHKDDSRGTEKSSAEKKKLVAETRTASSASDSESPILQKLVQPLKSVLQVRVEDEKDLLIRFARCCNPITGDPIIGYVSRGRGIIIHRKNCANLANINEFEKRKTEAEWENSSKALVKRFRIDARYSANLFSEIEGAIRRRQGHIIEGRLEETAAKEFPPSKGGGANRLAGFFTIQVAQTEDLKPVMKNIRGIPGVLGIQLLN